MSWNLNDNTYYRYPYCWFINFVGCEDKLVAPVVSPLPLAGPEVLITHPHDPLRITINNGDCSYELNFYQLVQILVAAFVGILVAYTFSLFVRKEFYQKTSKRSVGTSISFAQLNVGHDLDIQNNITLSIISVRLQQDIGGHLGAENRWSRLNTTQAEGEPVLRSRNSSGSRSRVSFTRSTMFTTAGDSNRSSQILFNGGSGTKNNNDQDRESTSSKSSLQRLNLNNRDSQEQVQVVYNRNSSLNPDEASEKYSSTSSRNCAVELHQHPRGNKVPCENPWGMRLECLLRALKISYRAVIDCDVTEEPWFVCRDLETHTQNVLQTTEGNYTIVIEFICNHFPEARQQLNDPRKEVPAHFLTSLVEYHLIPTLAKGLELNNNPVPTTGQPSPGFNSQGNPPWNWNGIVPTTKDDSVLKKALLEDLMSLSAALSEKPYFLGKSISEVDCTIFGTLVQMIWGESSSLYQQLIYRHSNLVDYCLRMKMGLWPDWDCNIKMPVGYHEEKTKSPNKSPDPTEELYYSQHESEIEDFDEYESRLGGWNL